MRCRTGSLLLVLSWGCELVAQRAPCTGTVVDAAGAPLTDAVVTFVEDPWQTFGEDPDRVEAKCDVAGAFRAELRPGGFYVVWAIGPTDRTGAHAVCDAQPIGAAGRTPALRVLVDGVPFAHDRPLAGDCELDLGPLPGPITLQLVDQTLRVVAQHATIDAPGDTPGGAPLQIRFRAPVRYEVEVRDGDGAPVPDAAISLLDLWLDRPNVGPIPAPGTLRFDVAAHSDRRGRATLVAMQPPHESWREGATLRVFASKPGVGCGLAGMSFGEVHARDRDQDDDARCIVVRVEPAPELTRTVQLPPGVQLLRAHLSTSVPWYTEARGGAWELPVPSHLVLPSRIVSQQPRQLAGLTAWLRLSDPRAPGALVLFDPIVGEQMDSTRIDCTRLRTTTLRVVDAAGRAAPFAALGFVRLLDGGHCHLVERRIADANGQLVVRHGEVPAQLVVADERGMAVAPLGSSADGAVQQVVLQPLRWVELTAFDGARRPLRGARVLEGQVLGRALEPVATMAAWQWLASLRADADGRLRLPLFDDGLAVKIGVGELRSDRVELRDTRARYLRLR